MTSLTLPRLPLCGQPATFPVEVYTLRDGHAHGSLDVVVYVCAGHLVEVETALDAAGLTPYRLSTPAYRRRCGEVWDYTIQRLLTAPEPVAQPEVAPERSEACAQPVAPAVEHPAWCDPGECSVTPQGQGTHMSRRSVIAGDNLTVSLHLDHSVTLPGLPVLVVLEFADPVDVAERADPEGLSFVTPMSLGQAKALRLALGNLLDAARSR